MVLWTISVIFILLSIQSVLHWAYRTMSDIRMNKYVYWDRWHSLEHMLVYILIFIWLVVEIIEWFAHWWFIHWLEEHFWTAIGIIKTFCMMITLSVLSYHLDEERHEGDYKMKWKGS